VIENTKRNSLLAELLKKALALLAAQAAKIKNLSSPPFLYATVVKVYPTNTSNTNEALDQIYKELQEISEPTIEVDPDFQKKFPNICRLGGTGSLPKKPADFSIENNQKSAAIAVNGKLVEVAVPADKDIKPGDTVRVHSRTLQIIDVIDAQFGGEIAVIRRVLNEHLVEIKGDANRIVFSGQFANKLQNGDRVVLDATLQVVVMNLGKENADFHFELDTNVSWDDIGGLSEAKEKIIEVIEKPYSHPQLYAFYKKKPAKGILLFGPPGCGKTHLVKAVVTSIKKVHGGKGQSTAFISLKGPEILERFVGVAEETVRNLFKLAKKHKETYGYPAVIFLDEAEAILQKRGSGVSSDVEKTIVPAFLTEMNGLEDSGAIVILATNRPDILDPAITRDGRIDKHIKVDRPNKEAAREIFQIHLRGIPTTKGISSEELARLATEELFSEKRVIYEIGVSGGETMRFTFASLVNGALVAGIVSEAITIAIDRDKDKKESNYTGLTKEDIVKAVDAKFKEKFDLNHTDEMREFTTDFSEKVKSVRKLKLSS
jgi:proteasome-associated ATPase